MIFNRNWIQWMTHLPIRVHGDLNYKTDDSEFLDAFICLSFILMAVDFSRTHQGYAVHVFILYCSLEAG